MATQTTKLGLDKPATTDLVDIAVLNTNFDDIDAAAGATICTSTTRPSTPWNGQIIFETDTLGGYVWRSATSSWTSLGGSTVSSDPPATAANGDLWWDSDNGKLYIYYVDANSSQWVSVMPATTQVEVAQNLIINGDFGINQRAFTSTTTAWAYHFDRWRTGYTGGTVTTSTQVFTPGTALATVVEPTNYVRIVTSGQAAVGDSAQLAQPIEDVRTFAGQIMTVSFWAKAATGTPKIGVSATQSFGTGGSTAVTTIGSAVTLGTSWNRYSVTLTVPSISGKTIGVGSYVMVSLFTSAGTSVPESSGVGIQNNTFDIWGVQAEKGSVPTSFRLAGGGTKQAELSACQRYYTKVIGANDEIPFTGHFYSASQLWVGYIYPVPMRATPTFLGMGIATVYSGGSSRTVSAFTVYRANSRIMGFYATYGGTPFGAGGSGFLSLQDAYLEWSAEL